MILLRLAAQNVGRAGLRASLLALAVMLATGVAIAGIGLGWALREAGDVALSRLGADLLVLPHGTPAAPGGLVAAPSAEVELDPTLAARIAATPGIARIAPQRVLRAELDGRIVTLVGFDPEADLTLQPWLAAPAPAGTVLLGASARGAPGEVLSLCGHPLPLGGRLGGIGIGRLDEAYFVPFPLLAAAIENWAMICRVAGVTTASAGGHAGDPAAVPRADAHGGIPGYGNCLPMDLPAQGVSAILIRLAPGVTAEQARFALGRLPGIAVVAGDAALTTVRQGIGRMLAGAAALGAALLAALGLLVWLLFGSIVQERQREMGLLRTVGARPGQLRVLMALEAAIVTGAGVALGIGLGLLLLALGLGALSAQVAIAGIPALPPPAGPTLLAAAGTAGAAFALGIGGALFHAWRAGRADPHALVQAASGAGRP